MKLSLKYVCLTIVITSLCSAYFHYRQEKVLLDENNLKNSYEEYLNQESKEAEKKFGKLLLKNAKADLKDLKDLSIKECKELTNNQYECLVEVNIRGEHEYKQKINVTAKNSKYQITQKTIL